MRIQIQIHLLTRLDTQQSKRCSTLVDECENGGIGGIIKAVERTVVDGETVLPQVKGALDAGQRCVGGWSSGSSGGIVNDLRRSIVATESLGAASEVGGTRRRGFVFVVAWTGPVSWLKLALHAMVAKLTCAMQYILSRLV